MPAPVCPHCKKDLKIPTDAEHGAYAYGKPVVTSTACCGKGVRLTRVCFLSVDPLSEIDVAWRQGLDDWGRPIKEDV